MHVHLKFHHHIAVHLYIVASVRQIHGSDKPSQPPANNPNLQIWCTAKMVYLQTLLCPSEFRVI